MRRVRATISMPIRVDGDGGGHDPQGEIGEDVGGGVRQPSAWTAAATIASTPVAATVIGP